MPRRPIRKNINVLSRKLHRWGAFTIALPLLVVISTGLLLQLKKQSSWIQPKAMQGTGDIPTLTFEQILTSALADPFAGWTSWNDIDRLDVRPSEGIIKVRGKNHWEVQLDATTGEILQSTYRRSDIIESLHDGSWFHDNAKLWIFFPAGIILGGLWLTGVYLWILPINAKRAGRKRRTAATNSASITP